MGSQKSDKQTIDSLINQRIEAIKSQDIEKAVANYSEDLLMFDIVGELSNVGVQAVKNRLTEWFSSMKKLVNYEVRIIDMMQNDNLAFCNSFNHIEAITKDGGQLDMWWRETLGWKKQNGNWFVVTAHSSVPFDGQSGKASVALKPSKELTESNSTKEKSFDISVLVKNIFRAYETKDKPACESLLAENFTFTSPNDDHINKDNYFKRCWPFSDQNPVYEFEKIAVSGDDVFVLYNCKTKTGKKFRNTEMFKFEKEKVKAVEVYFGDTQE